MKFLDTQKYSECQLVSVINAAVYLGEPGVDPESQEYERLVDLVGARYGDATRLDQAVSYLRLVSHPIHPVSIENIKRELAMKRPVQVVIWHPIVFSHGVLLVDDNGRSVRVYNLRRKGFAKDRLAWGPLAEMIASIPPNMRWAIWYEVDRVKRWIAQDGKSQKG